MPEATPAGPGPPFRAQQGKAGGGAGLPGGPVLRLQALQRRGAEGQAQGCRAAGKRRPRGGRGGARGKQSGPEPAAALAAEGHSPPGARAAVEGPAGETAAPPPRGPTWQRLHGPRRSGSSPRSRRTVTSGSTERGAGHSAPGPWASLPGAVASPAPSSPRPIRAPPIRRPHLFTGAGESSGCLK